MRVFFLNTKVFSLEEEFFDYQKSQGLQELKRKNANNGLVRRAYGKETWKVACFVRMCILREDLRKVTELTGMSECAGEVSCEDGLV